MNLGHHEIEELLGAYALDAVDPEERLAIEDHLAECPRCRAEVTDHREVASMLAMSGSPAPEGVWDRIVDSIDVELPPSLALPPVLPVPPHVRSLETPSAPAGPARRRARARWGLAVGTAAATIAAAVIGVLAVKVVDQGNRIDDLVVAGGVDPEATSLERAALDAWSSSAGRRTTLLSADGTVSARAVITPQGRGYVLGDNVPEAGEGRTYQLWGIADGTVLSLGVLGTEVDVAAFHADDAVGTLAITEEASPGVVISSQVPTVVGTLA